MFSIVMPLDTGRFEQFEKTKRYYDSTPQEKEFLIPTRNYDNVAKYLESKELTKNVRLIPYSIETGFNVSKALNLGVKNAKYDTIIITSPEVLPLTAVLDEFTLLKGKNVLAQVFDEAEDGGRITHANSESLVNSKFRNETPAMYFLAMFNKADIEKINGWDENFMAGYAYEDDDFGHRWVRAGLPFEVHDEIQGLHQYHPRAETIAGGTSTNFDLYQRNNTEGIISCLNGIVNLNKAKEII